MEIYIYTIIAQRRNAENITIMGYGLFDIGGFNAFIGNIVSEFTDADDFLPPTIRYFTASQDEFIDEGGRAYVWQRKDDKVVKEVL